MLEQDFVDEYIYGIAKEGYKARALYDYQAGNYYGFIITLTVL